MSQRNYQGHKETNKDKKDQARPKITWEGYKWIKKQKKGHASHKCSDWVKRGEVGFRVIKSYNMQYNDIKGNPWIQYNIAST